MLERNSTEFKKKIFERLQSCYKEFARNTVYYLKFFQLTINTEEGFNFFKIHGALPIPQNTVNLNFITPTLDLIETLYSIDTKHLQFGASKIVAESSQKSDSSFSTQAIVALQSPFLLRTC